MGFRKWLKQREPFHKFLLLIPFSVILFIVSSILHNLVYALIIVLFGEGVWESYLGGDEVLFFVIAVVVSPILFLIGVAGSIYWAIRKLLHR